MALGPAISIEANAMVFSLSNTRLGLSRELAALNPYLESDCAATCVRKVLTDLSKHPHSKAYNNEGAVARHPSQRLKSALVASNPTKYRQTTARVSKR